MKKEEIERLKELKKQVRSKGEYEELKYLENKMEEENEK